MGDPKKYLDIAPIFTAQKVPILPFTGINAANRLLGRDANALLIGLILDQQISSERAFAGPYELKRRLGHLNVRKIAAMPEEELVAVVAQKPAIHRFPASMGRRIHAACTVLLEQYDGKAENIWKEQPDAKVVMKRLSTIPGIGPAKQRLGMLILGRYYRQNIPGWREASPIEIPV
ncbi:MAG: HhH-GPD-type base excision DNA repair protein [Dehalococcoidia bacterium]